MTYPIIKGVSHALVTAGIEECGLTLSAGIRLHIL